MSNATTTSPSYEALNGIPRIDIAANVHAALSAGRRATSIARETAALRFGAGRLMPEEYFYYRLWEADLPLAAKRQFVGKLAQTAMHLAAGTLEWYAALISHSIADILRARILAIAF